MTTPSASTLPSRRAPWLRRSALAVLVLAAAGYLLRDVIMGKPVDVTVLARGDVVQTVVATGRIATPQRVTVSAVQTERVARIPVAEGQTVRAGAVLIELDDRDERAAVAQARAAVAQAEAKLRQLREVGLPGAEQAQVQARANLALAQRQYQRNQDLLARGFISQSAVDDAKRNLDVAESQARAAELNVASSRPSGSDYAMAQTALAQAQAALVAAEAKLAQMVVVAPVDGVLIARDVEVGDVVQAGKALMVLAPAGTTQIVVQIDEKNLGQLSVGQKALASADAYPNERFAAQVAYINPGVDPLRGAVEVKLDVPSPPSYLRQDMTVSVDIEVARRSGTLVAPADAVFDAAGSAPWMLVVTDHRATRRPVKLGLRGATNVEVLGGVAAGDRVVSAADGVVPGQRVRVEGAAASVPSGPAK